MSAIKLTRALVFALLLAAGLVFLYPVYLALISSLKSQGELADSVFALPREWLFGNYEEVMRQAHYVRALGNSVYLVLLAVAVLLIVGSMASYGIARWQSRAGKWLGFYFFSGLIAPFQLALIPLYKVMRDLGLSGTLTGLALLNVATSLPLGIFLWSTFVRSLPREMEESAEIDGCGLLRTYWQIVFPLLLPVTATVVILCGIGIWNEFLFSLLFLPRPQSQTLPLTIYNFVGQYGNSWPQIFAVMILIEAPVLILYVLLQRFIIKGMTSGAVKG